MDPDKTNRWLTLVANIGVLIGLIVLIFELSQNTEMMRAQMHSDAMSIRTANRFAEANSGEYARILAKLEDASGTTSMNLAMAPLDSLTTEERMRLRLRMIGLRDDLANLFYQCQEGFLDTEFCEYRLPNQISGMLRQWHTLKVRIIGQRPSFLAEIQRIAKEEGLPAPNDQGQWDE